MSSTKCDMSDASASSNETHVDWLALKKQSRNSQQQQQQQQQQQKLQEELSQKEQRFVDDERQRQYQNYAQEDRMKLVGWERAKEKMIENPFVPIGALLTLTALSFGLHSLKTGNRARSQLMMRCRIIAQGFTIAAMVAGLVIAAAKE